MNCLNWFNRRCGSGSAVTVILLVGLIARSGAQAPIPREAFTLAQQILEERWIPSASDNPELYDLGRLDPTSATLGEPFRELELRGHNIDAFLQATESDPTKFAGVERYCFPLLIGSGDAEAIVVIRNRNETGAKFSPEFGEFMLFGYYFRNNPLVAQVKSLRSVFPRSSEVAWVWFVDALVAPHIIVRQLDGPLLAGESESVLRPVSEVSPGIRINIRAARERASTRVWGSD